MCKIHFILEQHTTCFGLSLRPSSEVSRLYIQHQIYVTVSGGSLLAGTRWNCVPSRQSETCRVLFQNKMNFTHCGSGWFYYTNILRCTVLRTSSLYRCTVHYGIYILFIHQQMHFLLNLQKFKFILKYTQLSLPHVSVFDHSQGACT